MSKLKVGDRYKFKTLDNEFVWEVNDRGIPTIISTIKGPMKVGYQNQDWGIGEYDEYLGNFAKSNNFKIIYDILNGV